MTLTIKGNIINTNIEEHRKILGNYGELLLELFFIKNKINFENQNNINKYSRFDFKINLNNMNYIVELKTRIGNIENHSIEILDYNKIQYYLYLKKTTNTNIKIIFIFNHLETEDMYNFYYYEIDDIDILENICFLNTSFKNKYYELPIRYLKPIENLINFL